MIYVATKCGASHSASEDTALVGTEIFVNTNAVVPFPELGFICVADGVGGNCGGAKASSYICTALTEAEGLHPDMLQDYLYEENEDVLPRFYIATTAIRQHRFLFEPKGNGKGAVATKATAR